MPEFRDMEIEFRINLYRNTEDTEVVANQETSQELLTNQETTQKADKRTDNRQMILAEIRKTPSITQKQLENITGLFHSDAAHNADSIAIFKYSVLLTYSAFKTEQTYLYLYCR